MTARAGAARHAGKRPAAGALTAPAPRIDARLDVDRVAERASLVAGLRARTASIAPKYFYDERGCALFARICTLPEYYPTRTERAIFDTCRNPIRDAVGTGRTLVDLGAGDGRKAAAWFDALGTTRYIAVDIAAAELASALAALHAAHPGVDISGVVADFTQGLDLDADLGDEAVTFFYPGSSIGNFAHDGARAFLTRIAVHCAARTGSGLLIGVDTRKDPARLLAAYDDAAGITAAFNRNVLDVVNPIAAADFVPSRFIHRATYDDAEGRVAMMLEARTATAVMIDGEMRLFAAGERIHTEDSYKYAPAEFARLLRAAGFRDVECWQDSAGDFAVFHASAAAAPAS